MTNRLSFQAHSFSYLACLQMLQTQYPCFPLPHPPLHFRVNYYYCKLFLNGSTGRVELYQCSLTMTDMLLYTKDTGESTDAECLKIVFQLLQASSNYSLCKHTQTFHLSSRLSQACWLSWWQASLDIPLPFGSTQLHKECCCMEWPLLPHTCFCACRSSGAHKIHFHLSPWSLCEGEIDIHLFVCAFHMQQCPDYGRDGRGWTVKGSGWRCCTIASESW